MSKNSFVLYMDYEQHIDLLSDEQAGVLLKSIMKYAAEKELPVMDGMTQMAFSFIRNQIDRDALEYKKAVEIRKENGRKGGRPKKQKEDKDLEDSVLAETDNNFEKYAEPNTNFEKEEKPKKPTGFSDNQTKPKKTNGFYENQEKHDNVYVNVNDTVNVNDKHTYTPQFEELWSVYPRKFDKTAAFKAYQARLQEGFSADELLLAVKRYAESCATLDVGERYVKYASTFFSRDKPFADYLKTDYKPPSPPKSKNKFINFHQRDNTSLYAELEARGI